MSAPFTLPESADVADIRRELEALIVMADIEAGVRWASAARRLDGQRSLERAAELGAAMLDALDLPPVVLDAMDHAIAKLDALDGDPDLEPSLGYYTPGYPYDAEHEPEHDEDDGTREPSLASPERSPWVPHSSEWRRHFRIDDGSQARWAAGAQHDGEAVDEDGDTLDEDGEEDRSDHEPSIGWPNDFEAHRGLTGAGYDEMEPDEDREDDGRDPEPLSWVFGPSRREAAHA